MAPTDREVLVALYNATDGPNWKKKTNWDTDADLSDWYGVKVNDQGRVVVLRLVSNNLRGTIPEELGKLPALKGLLLTNNQLTGTIPLELGNIRELRKLWLNNNKLTGEIPASLGQLGKLREVILSVNQLSGPIPPELGQLGALEKLHLARNWLSGTIPEALGKLTALDTFFLNDNQLSGPIPPELGNLGELQILWLNDNKLTGAIPKELGALSELTKLWLGGNQLTGEIPASLGQLCSLTGLDLGSNKLSGLIPSELGNLRGLESLALNNNQLAGPIPKEMGRLSELKELRLHWNKLTGTIPEELGELTALEELYLGSNISGPIPPELGQFGALEGLYLGQNRLGEPIPEVLRGLSELSQVVLSNRLTGPIPKELGDLKALTCLDLSNNELIDAPKQLLTGAALARWQEKVRGAGRLEPLAVSLVDFLVALWHFLIPIFDDITDVILLMETFEDRGGLWWACCCSFMLADVERVFLLLVTLVLVLLWIPFALLGTDESRNERFKLALKCLNGCHELRLETYFVRWDSSKGVNVWGVSKSALRWPILDGFMWVVVGSRSKSSSLMRFCGMAGYTPVGRLEQSGLGLSLIDRIVDHHPYSMLGRVLFSYPHGHHLPGSDEATRRAWVMLRAVGETLVVDSLFFALSLSSETWEDGVSIGIFSLTFSVLELLTELQYYVSEARADMVTGGEEPMGTSTEEAIQRAPAV